MRKLSILGVVCALALATGVVGVGATASAATPAARQPATALDPPATQSSTDTMYWPVTGTITDTIRCRVPGPGGSCNRQHKGLDIGGTSGHAVGAVYSGIVTNSYPETCGWTVEVTHSGGYISKYRHLDENLTVLHNGDQVSTGTTVGIVSNGPYPGPQTCWTGPHLHLEIVKGTWIKYDVNVADNDPVVKGQAIPYSFPGLAPLVPADPPLPPRAPVSAGRNYDGGSAHEDILWIGSDDGNAEPLWWGQTARGAFANGPINGQVTGKGMPVAGDFNGDGRADFIWYRPGSGAEKLWFSWTPNREFLPVDIKDEAGATRGVNGRYTPVIGDFNGDGRDDVFWYGVEGATESTWYGRADGSFRTDQPAPQIARNGLVPIVGDYDGDGKDDIFFYGRGHTAEALWQGLSSIGVQFANVGAPNVSTAAYEPVAGDFSGDGRDDIYWYQPEVDNDALWTSYGSIGDFANSTDLDVSGDFLPVGGNFDGDGFDDVFWYGEGGLFDAVWYWNTNGTVSSQAKPVNGVYQPT